MSSKPHLVAALGALIAVTSTAHAGLAKLNAHYEGEHLAQNKVWLRIQNADATGALEIFCRPCPGAPGRACQSLRDSIDGKETRIMPPQSCQVRYLTAAQRSAHLVTVGTKVVGKGGVVSYRGTKLHDARGNVLDTIKTSAPLMGADGNPLAGAALRDGLSKLAQGLIWTRTMFDTFQRWKSLPAIWVVDADGNLYVTQKYAPGYFNHSSFLAGKPVVAAGEIEIKDGVITRINNQSGHYKPTDEQLESALGRLAAKKIPTKQIKAEFCEKGRLGVCASTPYHPYAKPNL